MKTVQVQKQPPYNSLRLYPTFKEWKHKLQARPYKIHPASLYPTFKEWKQRSFRTFRKDKVNVYILPLRNENQRSF